MTQRFLQNKNTGHVIIWQSHLANDPLLVEVADARGTPMNVFEGEYATVTDSPAPAPVKKPRAKKAIEPKEPTVDDLDLDTDAALSADASRGL